jgi:Tfp pilus assembly protein PilN
VIRLGIEIGDADLRVARAERRLGRTRIVATERVRVEGDVAATVAGLVARHRATSVGIAVSLHAAAHRFLDLPFGDGRRLAEVVPLELLGQLPVDPGDAVVGFDVVARSQAGATVFAAAMRAEDLGPARAALAACGAARGEASLGPVAAWSVLTLTDGILVVADGERSSVSVRRDGRLVAVRALASEPRDPAGFAIEVRWTLAAADAVGPLVVAGADASDALVAALGPDARLIGGVDRACAVAAGVALGPRLVLARRDDVATPRERRRLAALATAAALLALADVGVVRIGLGRREAALARAVHDTAAAALPAGTRIVAPRAQLEAAAGAAARDGAAPRAVLALLRDLSTRVPQGVHLDLDELVIEGDVVRLHGRADGFDAVDVVRRSLAATPGLRDVAAEDARAAVDGRGVEFGVRASWHPVAGAPS